MAEQEIHPSATGRSTHTCLAVQAIGRIAVCAHENNMRGSEASHAYQTSPYVIETFAQTHMRLVSIPDRT